MVILSCTTFHNGNNFSVSIKMDSLLASTKQKVYLYSLIEGDCSILDSAFTVGNNNKFTIFVDIQNVKEGTTSKADLVYVISGEYSAEGISNLYYANFMLNDYGDVNNIYIGNGQGRVIHDADGLSEFQ